LCTSANNLDVYTTANRGLETSIDEQSFISGSDVCILLACFAACFAAVKRQFDRILLAINVWMCW